MHLQAESKSVPIDSIKEYPGNPRKGNIELIRESLRANGQYRDVVVQRSTGYVLVGNHTRKAAKEEGWSEIRATFIDCDDEQAKRIVLVDNRANDVAGYDLPLLADILRDLPTLEGTGFNADAVGSVLASLRTGGYRAGADPDAVPTLPTEPKAKLGDVYLLGAHRLLCGDSTNLEHVDRLMDGEKARCLFTDPPYGVDYDGGMKKRERLAADVGGNLSPKAETTIYTEMLPSVMAACENRAPLYIWHAHTKADEIQSALRDAGYPVRSQIIWVKNNAQFISSAHYKQKHEPCFYAVKKSMKPWWYGPKNEVTIWNVDRSPRNDYHPTQKPVELVERALRNSTVQGDSVLDLFGGSGSTLIACEGLERRCYMMELEPAYVDVIVQRWEDLTNEKAVLCES
jgi:DNA modification methylase